jgi:acetyl-CoA acetyltransferase
MTSERQRHLRIRNQVALVGGAFSHIARHSTVPIGILAAEAVKKAVADAGIPLSEVDGLSVYPPASHLGAGTVDGTDFVGLRYMANALSARNIRWTCSVAPGSFVGSIVEAVNAVAAGACTYAVVWRAMHNPRGEFGGHAARWAHGDDQFTAPYGLANVVMSFALSYSRYLAKYGATREHMTTFIVNNRLNASRNPEAVFFDRPITREQYLADRMVSEPFSVLDCDYPVDGAGAVVITTAERARNLQNSPAYVGGYSSLSVAFGHSPHLFALEFQEEAAALVARSLWESSGLRPSDVSQANLYDGFSSFIYLWLEALGFCLKGEAFEFIQGGRIAIGGELPLNTSGGSLGMGRLHGSPQVIEAMRQVQGRAGSRQVPGAKVALALSGPAGFGAAALLLTNAPNL